MTESNFPNILFILCFVPCKGSGTRKEVNVIVICHCSPLTRLCDLLQCFFFLINASIFILAVAAHVSSSSCLLLLTLKPAARLRTQCPALQTAPWTMTLECGALPAWDGSVSQWVGKGQMVMLGRGRAGQLGSGLSSGLESIPEGARKVNM